MSTRASCSLLLASLTGLAACSAPRRRPTYHQPRSASWATPTSPAEPTEKTVVIVGTSADLHGYVEPRQLQGAWAGRTGPSGAARRSAASRRLPRQPAEPATPCCFSTAATCSKRHHRVEHERGPSGRRGPTTTSAITPPPSAITSSITAQAGPHSVPKAGTDDDPTGALKLLAKAANFPFLSANLLDRATGQPVAWQNVQPSRIVELAGSAPGCHRRADRRHPTHHEQLEPARRHRLSHRARRKARGLNQTAPAGRRRDHSDHSRGRQLLRL